MSKINRVLIFLVSFFCAIGLITLFYFYLIYPDFCDSVDAQFVLGAQVILSKLPLYTAPNSADQYSMLYGPATYLLLTPFILFFKNPILGAKIFGITLFLLGSATFIALLLKTRGALVTFLIFPFYLLLSLNYKLVAFQIRADCVVVLGVLGFLLASTFQNKTLKWSIQCLCLTLSIQAKIYSGILFLPAFVLMKLDNKLTFKHILSLAVGTIALSLALFFVLPQLSLTHYVFWILLSLHHGHYPFLSLLTYYKDFIFIFIPLLGIGFFLNLYSNFRFIALTFSLLFTFTAVTFLSLKVGAGHWYCLPLCGVSLYIFSDYLDIFLKRYDNISKHLGILFLLCIVLVSSSLLFLNRDRYPDIVRTLSHDNRLYKTACRKEALSVQQRFPKATLAIATYPPHFDALFYSPKVLKLAYASAQDAHLGGKPLPSSTLKAIESETADIYLCQKGVKPFETPSIYSNQLTYDSNFYETFHKHYHFEKSLNTLDVWVSNKFKTSLSK